MTGIETHDPRNDFYEEVHLGRRFPLCCSTVILRYDSSTGGEYLYNNFALQEISNVFGFELNYDSARFHGLVRTNYP